MASIAFYIGIVHLPNMMCVVVGLALALGAAPANEANAIRLTNESAMYWEKVKPDQALASAQAAKQMWEQIGQTNRREYLVAINNVITAELLRGSLRDAEPLVKQAHELYLRTLPASDPMLPLSLTVLATAYKALGNYAEAGKIAEQALQMAEAQKAPAPVLSKLKSGLGDILGMQERLGDARQLLRDAVAPAAGESDSDIVNRAAAYRSLASVERRLGQYLAAEADGLQGLRLLENRHGQADAVRAEALSELGVLAEQQNRWKDAERYLTEAVRIVDDVFGAGRPGVSPTYSNLAGLYLQRGRYDKAENLYRKVLTAESAVFPAEHPAIARDLNNLGSLEFRRRRFATAEDLLSRALQMMEDTVGPASAETAQVEVNLANALFELKHYSQAQTHYGHALGTLDRCWGEDDPRLMGVLSGFAALSRAQAEAAQAEKLETRMEHIRVRQAISSERQQTSGSS
jgi:tetratricopeptide (TPR) repeat protein